MDAFLYYFLTATALVLLIISYKFNKAVLEVFSSVLLMTVGGSFLLTDIKTFAGQSFTQNSSIANLTVYNLNYTYATSQVSTGFSWNVWGIMFVLLGFYLLFDGGYRLATATGNTMGEA
jgi:uncharacterized membrane protein